MGRLKRKSQDIETHNVKKDKSDLPDLNALQKKRFDNPSELMSEIGIKQTKKKKPVKVELAKKTKGFKLYEKIIGIFVKRVNVENIKYLDNGMPKNYFNESSYMMFLLQFAEKYELYELFRHVDEYDGELLISNQEVKEHINKKLK